MKICIYISLLLLSCSSSKDISYVAQKQKVFDLDIYKNCVVAVDVTTEEGNLFGASGIVIGKDLVITNQHILEEKTEEIWVHWDDSLQKNPIQATSIFTDKKNDLLLLKLKTSSNNYINIEQSNKVDIGEDILVIGFPEVTQIVGSSTLHIFKGCIAAEQPRSLEERPRLILDAKVMQGNSGGPVVSSKSGKIVGVVSSLIFDVIETKDSSIEGESAGIAIPMESILRFLASYKAHLK